MPVFFTFEELNRKLAKDEEIITQMTDTLEQTERKFHEMQLQQAEHDTAVAAGMRNSIAELESRKCNGEYLLRFTDYGIHLENARHGLALPMQCLPIYTSFYGYKVGLRLYPNVDETGYGLQVTLFVKIMQSEWDDTLEWPFCGRISLSLLDQSDDGECKVPIIKSFVIPPNSPAFQRPTTPERRDHIWLMFVSPEMFQQRQYMKNDCLLFRVQFNK